MHKCTSRQYQEYLKTFTVPDPALAKFIKEDTVGLIELPLDQFRYSSAVDFEFETAVMVEEKTGRKLLFIRLDSYNPEHRQHEKPDYCIPLAYKGASERERLSWTIPFGGAWSDTREECLMVFEEKWIDWFKKVKVGLVFTNPGAPSATYMELNDREWESIRAFCQSK